MDSYKDNDTCIFELSDVKDILKCKYCGNNYTIWSLMNGDYRSLLNSKCSKRKLIESFNGQLNNILGDNE